MPRTRTLSQQQIRLISKALADPRRHEILKQAGANSKGAACADLLECQRITAPTLSHHVKQLETAGLISTVREGKFCRLVVRRDTLDAYLKHLSAI